MAQPDAHHTVDIGAGAGGISCCPVCMEPPEWVAIGPCGHGEVCVACAVRTRFFQEDRRCCICRAFCPTVVVTTARDDDVEQRAAAAFAKPSPAFSGVGRVGVYYWYHAGMAAYFDDREQYEAVTKMCSKPPLHQAGGGGNVPLEPSCPDFVCFLLYLVVVTLMAVGTAIPLAIYLKHWAQRLALALAFAIFGAGVSYLTWYEGGQRPPADSS
ncbi:hypothetical protein ACP70R_006522 [Stipagrostis hirtigluma subsp. patula]